MIVPEVKLEGIDSLNDAIRVWTEDLGRSAEGGFAKSARLVTWGMHRAFRENRTKPVDIVARAKARGFEMADSGPRDEAARWNRSWQSAKATLDPYKSGYFRIIETSVGIVARPIVVGRKRRIVLASRKNFRQRGTLLNSPSAQLNKAEVPAGAVRLNRQSLAVVRQLQTRSRAAEGSYLGAQFLTYKKFRGKERRRLGFITKNNLEVGQVVPGFDGKNRINSYRIIGGIEGTAKQAAKIGAVERAFAFAKGQYEADINQAIAERMVELVTGVKAGRKPNRPRA